MLFATCIRRGFPRPVTNVYPFAVVRIPRGVFPLAYCPAVVRILRDVFCPTHLLKLLEVYFPFMNLDG